MTEQGWLWLTPLYGIAPFILLLLAWFWRGRGLSISNMLLSATLRFRHPLMAQLPQTEYSLSRQRWQTALLLWVVAMLGLALAQPVKVGAKLPDLPPERDIMLLIDVSISMRLKDYEYKGEQVSRLDVLKGLINSFVAQTKGERLGVIVFAEKTYVLTPLTRDPALVQQQVTRVTTTLAGRVSALGDALLLAVKEAGKRPQRKQILVLFTDTDDSVGRITPTAAAELAREANIPIYSIAIGSTALESGQVRNGLLYQPVNRPLLQSLSAQTGGNTYEANNVSAIERALADINRLQQNEAAPDPYFIQYPLYHWFLLLALLPLTLWQIWQFLRRNQQVAA